MKALCEFKRIKGGWNTGRGIGLRDGWAGCRSWNHMAYTQHNTPSSPTKSYFPHYDKVVAKHAIFINPKYCSVVVQRDIFASFVDWNHFEMDRSYCIWYSELVFTIIFLCVLFRMRNSSQWNAVFRGVVFVLRDYGICYAFRVIEVNLILVVLFCKKIMLVDFDISRAIEA